MTERTGSRRPRLLLVATEDWFVASHFLGMARSAVAAGFEVAVVARMSQHKAAIEAAGLRAIPFETGRLNLGARALAASIRRYRQIFRDEQPDVVHAIALKPILLAGLAALGLSRTRLLLAPTGLGYLWIASGPTAWLGRLAVRCCIALLARRYGTTFLFENRDDAAALGLSPSDPRITVVPGAGVSPQTFAAQPDPGGATLRVAVVARMVRSKGIEDAVKAVEAARAGGLDVTLELWGDPDPGNPASLSREDLQRFAARPGIAWRGRASDVAAVWRTTHVAMQLSLGGEGLPRSLIEAAASARPLITTDTPGCRDLIQGGDAGFLVRPGDSAAAAAALHALADPLLRLRLGAAARRRFELSMTDEAVNGAVQRRYVAMLPS